MRLFLIPFLCCLCLVGFAQEPKRHTQLVGTVIDSIAKFPIEYATITVFKLGEKKPLTGTTTNVKGNFIINDLDSGAYSITIEFIGYKPYSNPRIFIKKNNDKIDLLKINLAKQFNQLQEVVVSSKVNLIENKIDKMVFNAEKDLTSQGGVATDILKKVPMVSVDINGNVELAGSSSVRFLINGKPSMSYGSNIADVLQAIPASEIKSVEVITNPGAKYDAQGLGGIINIILKQNKSKGYNTNLSLSAGTRIENGSINFNARKNNFGINAFFSSNARLLSATPSNSERNTFDTTNKTKSQILQEGSSEVKKMGWQSGIGFDWSLNKKNNFSGSIRSDYFDNDAAGGNNQTILSTNQITNIFSTSINKNITAGSYAIQGLNATLIYKHLFAKEDQELEISINTNAQHNTNTAKNNQFSMPTNALVFGRNNENSIRSNETEVQVDYTQPIAEKMKFGVGTKMVLNNINGYTDVYALRTNTNEFAYNNSLSNNLTYHQKVYALYAELEFPIKKIVAVKIGGRFERTDLNAAYSNAQQREINPGYNSFVPSIFFSRKLSENQTLKLSYSRRINRPGSDELNPFTNTSDPKNISSGNPFLKPEISNRVELAFSHQWQDIGSLMVSVFYRASDHDIQPYVVYYPLFKVGDSTYTNVNYSTNENIGMEKNTGINVFGDVHLNTKLTVRTNLFFFYRKIINALDLGYNTSSLNYRLNTNASYEFSKNIIAEFFGSFNSARNEVQGKYPSFTTYSFAIRKQFWNKKGSLALFANNPFSEFVDQRIDIFGPNFTSYSVKKVPYRSFGINFTWKFGKLEFKKSKDEEQNQNGLSL